MNAIASRLHRLVFQHWPLLLVVTPCLAVAAAGNRLQLLLRYDRAEILHGQVWRVFSGNFVHLGAGHLLEDMAGAVLLWLLFADVLSAWRMPLLIAAGSLAVGLGLLLGDQGVSWYVGISGALDTVWAGGAMELIRRRDRFGWILGGFLVAKLACEQLLGPLPLSTATTGGEIIVDAHLYGALAGAFVGAGWALRKRSV